MCHKGPGATTWLGLWVLGRDRRRKLTRPWPTAHRRAQRPSAVSDAAGSPHGWPQQPKNRAARPGPPRQRPGPRPRPLGQLWPRTPAARTGVQQTQAPQAGGHLVRDQHPSFVLPAAFGPRLAQVAVRTLRTADHPFVPTRTAPPLDWGGKVSPEDRHVAGRPSCGPGRGDARTAAARQRCCPHGAGRPGGGRPPHRAQLLAHLYRRAGSVLGHVQESRAGPTRTWLSDSSE